MLKFIPRICITIFPRPSKFSHAHTNLPTLIKIFPRLIKFSNPQSNFPRLEEDQKLHAENMESEETQLNQLKSQVFVIQFKSICYYRKRIWKKYFRLILLLIFLLLTLSYFGIEFVRRFAFFCSCRDPIFKFGPECISVISLEFWCYGGRR